MRRARPTDALPIFGVPTTFCLRLFIWDNLIYFGMGPKKGPDGKLAIAFPMGDKKLPGIAAEDIGRCALGIFKRERELIGKTLRDRRRTSHLRADGHGTEPGVGARGALSCRHAGNVSCVRVAPVRTIWAICFSSSATSMTSFCGDTIRPSRAGCTLPCRPSPAGWKRTNADSIDMNSPGPQPPGERTERRRSPAACLCTLFDQGSIFSTNHPVNTQHLKTFNENNPSMQ